MRKLPLKLTKFLKVAKEFKVLKMPKFLPKGNGIPNMEGGMEVPEMSNREIREAFIAIV